MFISTNEKQSMLLRIESLEDRVNTLARSLNAVLDKLTTATDDTQKLAKIKQERRNAYASAYYYRKKAEKAANLTKQGKI
jgi:hypothetical protein